MLIIPEANWWMDSRAFITRLLPLLCMFKIFHNEKVYFFLKKGKDCERWHWDFMTRHIIVMLPL